MFKILTTVMVFSSISYANSTNELAKSVIELRHETEKLKSDYELEKSNLQDELKSLVAQKAELEAGVNEGELRRKQVQTKIDQIRADINKNSVLSDDLSAVNKAALADIRTYITKSVPFRINERLISVTKLEESLEKEELSQAKGTTLIWSLIEDEKRMASETTLAKQNININGSEVLAEVVRVGMVAMYFKNTEEEYGSANFADDKWSYQIFKNKSHANKVELLFEDLKKQVRNGYYELPMVKGDGA